MYSNDYIEQTEKELGRALKQTLASISAMDAGYARISNLLYEVRDILASLNDPWLAWVSQGITNKSEQYQVALRKAIEQLWWLAYRARTGC